MNKLITMTLFMLSALIGSAQSSEIEMADGLYANGKIYVVLVCVLIIFAGLMTYVFVLDRKTKKLQEKLDKGQDK